MWIVKQMRYKAINRLTDRPMDIASYSFVASKKNDFNRRIHTESLKDKKHNEKLYI